MGKYDNLSGSWAIVTGAAGGIGLSFCKALARRGCGLVMIDLNYQRLSAARDLLSSQWPDAPVKLLCLDLTQPTFLAQIEIFCDAYRIDPDILINNAGIFSFNTLMAVGEKKTEAFVDLHVRAVTLLSRWMARKMEAGGRERWLLNMSSMSCWMPMPGLSLYAATKAYVRVLTRSLHYDTHDLPGNVMTACPGGIATDLFGLPENLKRLALAIGAIAEPDRFAEKALKRLFKGRQQYVNGLVNRLAIFFVGVTPAWVRMQVKRRMIDKGIRT